MTVSRQGKILLRQCGCCS